MSSNAAELASAPPPPLAARAGTLDTLFMLARREFWEHRVLWIAPLVTAVLLALCAVLGHADVDGGSHGAITARQKVALFTVVQWVLAQPLYLVMIFCVSFYLLDCLYAERKDRSILFWKSLPVSDGLTVLAKLAVALVAAPVVAFALALAANLVFFAVLTVRMALGSLPAVLSWNTLEWFRTEIVLLLEMLLGALWYAPIAAYLLLVSAWARRSPFLWATLPPVMAPILERIAFGTHYLWDFIADRTGGIWYTLQLGHEHFFGHFRDLRPVGDVLGVFNFGTAFTDIDLWLGVIAAAALVFAAARIRRYRDDS